MQTEITTAEEMCWNMEDVWSGIQSNWLMSDRGRKLCLGVAAWWRRAAATPITFQDLLAALLAEVRLVSKLQVSDFFDQPATKRKPKRRSKPAAHRRIKSRSALTPMAKQHKSCHAYA